MDTRVEGHSLDAPTEPTYWTLAYELRIDEMTEADKGRTISFVSKFIHNIDEWHIHIYLSPRSYRVAIFSKNFLAQMDLTYLLLAAIISLANHR